MEESAVEVVMGVRVVEIVAGSAVDSDATVVEDTVVGTDVEDTGSAVDCAATVVVEGVVVEGSALELSVDAIVVELVEAGVVDSVVAAVVL